MAVELDRITLQRCRRGDATAFRQLVELYQDRVYALCVALAGSEGEDLAQETFVRVHAALGDFDAERESQLSAWISTIARRLCVDRARRRQRRQRLKTQLPPAEPRAGADETLDRERLRAALRQAVAELPDEQRAVVALRTWDELAYEEIAAIEGVPVGTVRSRLARAKQALQRALGLAGDEERDESHDA